jgi:hypothetical protein
MNLAELHRFGTAFTEGFDALPFTAQRQVVLYFVDKIEVVERKLVRIHLKVPFDDNGIRLLTDDVVAGECSREDGENDEEEGSADPFANVNTRNHTAPHKPPCHSSTRPNRSAPPRGCRRRCRGCQRRG